MNEQIKEKAEKITKRIFQVDTFAGKLAIEINKFPKYYFIIATHSMLLKVDGYFQLAFPTPFNEQPTVLNLAQQQGQADSDELPKRLSKQLGQAVILSWNVETPLHKKGVDELVSVVVSLCRSIQ